MNWAAFWEQFNALIHSKREVNDVDKLTHLRPDLKDGPAQNVIERLSQTVKNYEEDTHLSNVYRSSTIGPDSSTRLMFVPFLKLLP